MATNNAINVATAASGTVLQGQGVGTTPAFSTATYPATTTINQILYSSSANVVSGITTANDGILTTSNTGVPAILAGPGVNGNMLQSQAAVPPVWSTSTYPATNAINTLLYASAANVMSALATANSGVLATSATGVPSIDATNFHVLTTGVQIKGNNANTAPPAGFIGEVQSSNVASPGTSLTSGVAANITTLTPTAGTYLLFGVIEFSATVGASTAFGIAGINTTTANVGTAGINYNALPFGTNPGISIGINTPIQQVSTDGSVVYYLVAQCTSTGSPTAYGKIQAVRIG